MDDIFDEVDSILNEEGSADEEATNFNESELHDIMSEIDDLEKEFEFVEEPMSLQEKIDAELAMELDELDATDENTGIKEVQKKAQVINFDKTVPVAASLVGPPSGVSFQAKGQMSLNLDFMIGQEAAKLVIDPVKGMIITLSGVELCINEDSGCTVAMDNGMKFTIPLSSPTNSLKKKSA